jgi:hypothetical protein
VDEANEEENGETEQRNIQKQKISGTKLTKKIK